MNEQQLTEFLTFCKQAIPEYKDLSLEQIAESLVQIQESDPETFQGILNSYKKAKQAFKRGGKLDAFVAKFANGGKSTKKCSCGCDLVKVAEKGGIVERCACGCKSKVVKAEKGAETENLAAYKKNGLSDLTVLHKVDENRVINPKAGAITRSIMGNDTTYKSTGEGLGVFRGTISSKNRGLVSPQYDIALDGAKQAFGSARIYSPSTLTMPEGYYQDGGAFTRAQNYYNKYSNSDSIRKIQNFLTSRGYNVGKIDGIFGKNTFNAIKQYQRDHNLKDDGMWGEDTNSQDRVLNAFTSPYRNDASGRSGAHSGSEQGLNRQYATTGQVTMNDINTALEKAIVDPEWFWGDSEDAVGWRRIFQSKGGEGLIEEVWSNTPAHIKKTVSYKKLPKNIANMRVEENVSDAINEGKDIALATTTIPLILTNPISAAAGMAAGGIGGYVGGEIGETYGRFLSDPNATYGDVQTDRLGNSSVVVIPEEEVNARKGRNIGEFLGALLGLIGGRAARSANPEMPGVTPKRQQLRVKDLKYKNNKPAQPQDETGRFITKKGTNTGHFAGYHIVPGEPPYL